MGGISRAAPSAFRISAVKAFTIGARIKRDLRTHLRELGFTKKPEVGARAEAIMKSAHGDDPDWPLDRRAPARDADRATNAKKKSK